MAAICEAIQSAPSSSESKSDVSAGSSGTSDPTSSSPEGDPKCRKSSRLKAKVNKQSKEGEGEDAYNLRLSSLVKRVQVERRQSTPKQPKGKSKPAPLSKYRRRTANARERMRMKEINEGFEHLRQSLPEMEEQKNQGGKKEKVTKLTVLNLALNYIHALRDILGYPDMEGSSSGGTPSGQSEESDLGSDAASSRTRSVSSSVSCDEICSNPSPDSSILDLKEFSLSDPSVVSSELPKHLPPCYDSLPGPSSMMEFRGEARSSPSSSDQSLSPSSLPLPEECMDIDESDLLDVSMSLEAWDSIADIIL